MAQEDSSDKSVFQREAMLSLVTDMNEREVIAQLLANPRGEREELQTVIRVFKEKQGQLTSLQEIEVLIKLRHHVSTDDNEMAIQ